MLQVLWDTFFSLFYFCNKMVCAVTYDRKLYSWNENVAKRVNSQKFPFLMDLLYLLLRSVYVPYSIHHVATWSPYKFNHTGNNVPHHAALGVWCMYALSNFSFSEILILTLFLTMQCCQQYHHYSLYLGNHV